MIACGMPNSLEETVPNTGKLNDREGLLAARISRREPAAALPGFRRAADVDCFTGFSSGFQLVTGAQLCKPVLIACVELLSCAWSVRWRFDPETGDVGLENYVTPTFRLRGLRP